MQNEITEPSDLLNAEGALIQRGWARKPLLHYNPENRGVGWHRLKEWDFYGVWHHDIGLSFFVADLGYLTLTTLSVYDFVNEKDHNAISVRFFTKGKLGLSRNSLEGDSEYISRRIKIKIQRFPDKHVLTIDSPRLKGLEAEVALALDPKQDSCIVSTGYADDPHKFYYNHKWNLLPATGSIKFKDQTHEFTPEDSFGNFDWGKGVWPYRTHWLWGSCAGRQDGHDIWINIGYGFGDLSTHTENMIFYDGKCHKIDQVIFHFDKKDLEAPWKFMSNDDRLDLTLNPKLALKGGLNLGFLKVASTVVHGNYTGQLVLDDGKKITIDNLHGHAEDCKYRW